MLLGCSISLPQPIRRVESTLTRTGEGGAIKNPHVLPGDPFLEDSYIICGTWVVLCISLCKYSKTLISRRSEGFPLTVLPHHPDQDRGWPVSKSEIKSEEFMGATTPKLQPASTELGRKLDRREHVLTRGASEHEREQESHPELWCPEAAVSA